MQQYCIIHGLPVDEQGYCTKCPRPMGMGGGSDKDQGDLAAQLENQRKAFEVMNEQLVNALAETEAERKRNNELAETCNELAARVAELEGELSAKVADDKSAAPEAGAAAEPDELGLEAEPEKTSGTGRKGGKAK